jgi:hypothetical protein
MKEKTLNSWAKYQKNCVQVINFLKQISLFINNALQEEKLIYALQFVEDKNWNLRWGQSYTVLCSPSQGYRFVGLSSMWLSNRPTLVLKNWPPEAASLDQNDVVYRKTYALELAEETSGVDCVRKKYCCSYLRNMKTELNCFVDVCYTIYFRFLLGNL